MTAMNRLAFRKMNGLGNDFVVLDARHAPMALTPDLVRHLADRNGPKGSHGGCDQVIVLESSPEADVAMRIYNADGSESGACGNAARCVAWLLTEENGRSKTTILTKGGLLRATTESRHRITIDMGEPRFGWEDIPLSEPCWDTRAVPLRMGPFEGRVLENPAVVNVGNPHAIFWVENLAPYDLGHFGPLLEHHPMFPERANISLAHVASRFALTLRTWERGAGLTRACGTAACAAAVSAARCGFTDRAVTVTLPGGDLVIVWTDENRILMTGPAEDEGTRETIVPERLRCQETEDDALLTGLIIGGIAGGWLS